MYVSVHVSICLRSELMFMIVYTNFASQVTVCVQAAERGYNCEGGYVGRDSSDPFDYFVHANDMQFKSSMLCEFSCIDHFRFPANCKLNYKIDS